MAGGDVGSIRELYCNVGVWVDVVGWCGGLDEVV